MGLDVFRRRLPLQVAQHEADNLALFGTLHLFPPNQAHLITSSIEHHAILHAAQRLGREGYSVTYLPVDEHGLVNLMMCDEQFDLREN